MDKKKALLISIIGLFALSVAGIVLLSNNNASISTSQTTRKTPYQLYLETHPGYNKAEAEWLDDLVNGRLGDKKTYIVAFNSNGGSQVEYQTIKEGEKATKPANPTRTGYKFKEWIYNGMPWVFYGYSVTENITLEASWEIIHYDITYDLNGGTLDYSNPTSFTVDSEFSLNSPSKDGYSFKGWFDGNTKITAIEKGTTGALNLTAQWAPNHNSLQISVNDQNKGTAKIIKGSGYTGENIIVQANSFDTFAFRGWYDDENNLVSKENPFSFVMPSSDIYYYAEFDGLKNLELSISDSTKGTLSGGGQKIIGDTVEVICNINSGLFKGWYDDNNVRLSSFAKYSFTMPSEDYHLTAIFYTNEEEEQFEYDVLHGIKPHFNVDYTKLTYGMFPQSVVSDDELINNLNSYANLNEPNEYNYYCFNGDYYVRKSVSIYNFERYYGVTTFPKQFDNGEEMLSDSIRWFKVEPVEWVVLKKVDSEYLLISSRVLEKAQFDKNGGTVIDDKPIYENNYEYCSIREWLNDDFYNKAFFLNVGDDNLILEKEVDNSPKSTGSEGNIYACNNTFDKVYLPSVVDTELIKEKNGNCAALTTDYLRSSSVYYNYQTMPYCGEYWTRSPDSDPKYDDHVKRVNEKGQIGRCSASLQHNIRPIISLNII